MRSPRRCLIPVLSLSVISLSCLGLSSWFLRSCAAEQLVAGFGKADITPDHPVATIYSRNDPAKVIGKVADALYARSAYFACGGQQALIISCDLLGLDGRFCGSVKGKISALGVPESCIAINASHTHTSPQTFFLRGVLMADEQYMSMLSERIVQSAKTALEHKEKAAIGYGAVETNLNVNRTEIGRLLQVNALDSPSGRVDNRVKVIRVDLLESRKTSLIVSFACHPLTVSDDTQVISADYPGRLCSLLETMPNVSFAQFLQGCGGNMNPKIHGAFPVVDQYARLLAQYVQGLYPSIQTSPDQTVTMQTADITLPRGPIPTVAEVEATLERVKKRQGGSKAVTERTISWAEDALAAIRSGRDVSRIPVIVQSIAFRDFMIATLPGETFAEIGVEIEKRIGGDVLVAGYSNQAEAGYIPTAEQFPKGGYEVDSAVKYYDLFPYLPETAERLTAAVVALSLPLKNKSNPRQGRGKKRNDTNNIQYPTTNIQH